MLTPECDPPLRPEREPLPPPPDDEPPLLFFVVSVAVFPMLFPVLLFVLPAFVPEILLSFPIFRLPPPVLFSLLLVLEFVPVLLTTLLL